MMHINNFLYKQKKKRRYKASNIEDESIEISIVPLSDQT